MAPAKKASNGRSPLVNQQRQITAFFGKSPSGTSSPAAPSQSPSPSPSPAISKLNPNPNPSASPSPSPSPITPSPLNSKRKKPLLVITPNLGATSAPKPTPESEKKSYGAEVVDRRVKVYWPLDKSWYEGVVKAFEAESGKHLVQYDDADEERLDLSVEKVEWIEEPVKKKLRRLRKFSVVEDDDEEDEGDEVDVKELEDDSDDEDWGGKVGNGELEEEDCLEDLDLEAEEEEEEKKNTSSRKRKGGEGQAVASKKGKSGGDLKNSVVSKLSPTGKAEKLIQPINLASAFGK